MVKESEDVYIVIEVKSKAHGGRALRSRWDYRKIWATTGKWSKETHKILGAFTTKELANQKVQQKVNPCNKKEFYQPCDILSSQLLIVDDS